MGWPAGEGIAAAIARAASASAWATKNGHKGMLPMSKGGSSPDEELHASEDGNSIVDEMPLASDATAQIGSISIKSWGARAILPGDRGTMA